MLFLLHEIKDEAAVYSVFEVLNSRGLPVSWLDRLKTILMGAAFELDRVAQDRIINDLHKIWREIYSTIGLSKDVSTEAVRFAATLKYKTALSRPLSEEDSVKFLRSLATDAKSITETAKWLLNVVKACQKVRSSERLNAVTEIAQARLLAVSIHLRPDLSDSESNNLLKNWEKVSFRIYGMLQKDARTGVGNYTKLAWRTVNESLSARDVKTGIRDIGANYPIEDAVKALRGADCYSEWKNELRYFLHRYEEHLAKEQEQNFGNEQWEKIWLASPSRSIEHIKPQSSAPDKYKHSIGNLMLLPPRLNSKLKNDSPKQKVAPYRRTGLLIASKVADLIERDGWSQRTVSRRGDEMLAWAEREWADEGC